MKGSTIFLHLATILGTSHALGTQIPMENTHEAQNDTIYLSTISTKGNTSHLGAFGFDPASASGEDPGYVIPVSHWGCTRSRMRASDIKDAIQLMIDWSNGGGQIFGKSIHIELAAHSATYLCNCKTHNVDTAPASEMWEFYERLRIHCGEGWSGWIFSKKWDKGFAVDTRDRVVNRHPKRLLCPLYCCN